ncbi:hypothetical protein [Bradyrhizobium genosp. P]|uniref:hypothetical protein n=1 Tax=Bradyrhizobium genosp. P TaxID=83641 RepID=UPI003CFB0233
MTKGVTKAGRNRAGRWKPLVRWLGAVTGLLGAGLGNATPTAAQSSDYQPAAAAPAAWQAFARQLQDRFQQRLAADGDTARQFRDEMAKRGGSAKATPATLTIRTWILPSGKVERVEFDGLDQDIAVYLRAVLIRDDVGAPPPDMLQPLHLRLTLRPKEPERGG